MKTKEIDEKREKIFKVLPKELQENSYASKMDGVTSITPFSESYPPKVGSSKYRMKKNL